MKKPESNLGKKEKLDLNGKTKMHQFLSLFGKLRLNGGKVKIVRERFRKMLIKLLLAPKSSPK